VAYHFRNLVFEGGGVKGLAYLGAMKVLQRKGILDAIRRVGGTSAGAINAALYAIGYTNTEQRRIMYEVDFECFKDDSWGALRDSQRLMREFGWYKGDYFHAWISELIAARQGSPDLSFGQLHEQGRPDLYVCGTNLCTGFSEVFSWEHTPEMKIADAVRISMSLPLFFAAVRNARRDVYVDGGLLDSYPVKLFDREKYISAERRHCMARHTDYYAWANRQAESGRYVYNKETLGLRLDSRQEIAMYRYGAAPQHRQIDSFVDYVRCLVNTLVESQANAHLHSDDWQRTIYIDTQGVRATDFSLSDSQKQALERSGEQGTQEYFAWFDDTANRPVNRP